MKTRFWVILFFAALLSVTANADNVFRLLRKGDTFQVGDRIIIVDTTEHKAIAQRETQGLVVGVDLGEVHDSISLTDDSQVAVFTLEYGQDDFYLRNMKQNYLSSPSYRYLYWLFNPYNNIEDSKVRLSSSSVYFVTANRYLCWNASMNCFHFSTTRSSLCIYRCACPEVTIDGEDVNADNSSILSKYKNQYVNLTVKRKFVENGGYYTLTLPFFLTSNDADYYFGGNKLCNISIYKGNNVINVYFCHPNSFWTNEAGYPCALNWTKGNVEQITFRGVCIESPTPNTIESEKMDEGVFKCVGIYDPTDIYTPSKVTRYLGVANGTTMLKTPKSGSGKLKGLRAYFVYPSSASVVKVSSQGVADGIARIDGELLQPSDDSWYSLQGMRLSGRPSLPGLYIHHGRKYIVR